MEITIEQAFNNLVSVSEKFVGTKQDHIVIEQSLQIIKDKIFTNNEVELK